MTRDEFLLKAVRSQGVERARLLDQALRAMPDSILPSYADEFREILKLDPTDQAGFRSKYLAQEARIKLNEAEELLEKKDWSGILRVLNEDFQKLRPTGEVASNAAFRRRIAHAT